MDGHSGHRPGAGFDRLVSLAARLFNVPIALVSLVDDERQWFKARCGLDVEQTPRSISFCVYAILGDDVMVVPDATLDPRFAENPLVTGGPRIRFYAGAPLITPERPEARHPVHHCLPTPQYDRGGMRFPARSGGHDGG